MTERNTDDANDEPTGGLRGLLGALSELAERVDANGPRAEGSYSVRVGLGDAVREESDADRRSGGRGIGLRPGAPAPTERDGEPGSGPPDDDGSSTGTEPASDPESDGDAEYDEPVSAVRTEGSTVVVALDLPGVDPSSLSAGVRGGAIVVAENGTAVARVPLVREGAPAADDLAVAYASYNNGVLELRLRPEGDTG
jgi:HSP20 family molecular chaperone IbpA